MKEKINIFSWTLISTYSIICGILYLTGFWSFFNINSLQFINISDVLKSVAIPLSSALIAYAVNIVLHNYNFPDEETTKNYLNEGGFFKFWIYFTRFICILVAIAMVVSIFLDIFYFEPQYKIRGYILTLSMASFIYLSFNSNFLAEREKYRVMFIAFICFMPSVSLNKGLIDGKDIINGKNTYLVSSDSGCVTQNQEKFRYISTLSDKAFAMSLKDGSVCIFNYNYLKLTKEAPSVVAK